MNKWNGFRCEEFEFEGRRAAVVFPEEPDKNRNWSLKTEYRDAFPETEIDLLKKGFHVAWVQNKSRFATVEDCDIKAMFADFLHSEYGLRDKCVPIGMSCGGAHAMNFAGLYPEKIACMYIDAPVLNFLSFPGKLGHKMCEEVWENEFIKAYPNITRAGLLNFDNHPICKLDVIKKHKIPIIMLYGDEDATVFYNENGRLLELEYADAPELLKVVVRTAQGHHPHGIPDNPKIVTDFIIEHTRRKGN